MKETQKDSRIRMPPRPSLHPDPALDGAPYRRGHLVGVQGPEHGGGLDGDVEVEGADPGELVEGRGGGGGAGGAAGADCGEAG